jgi:hypothetical protein
MHAFDTKHFILPGSLGQIKSSELIARDINKHCESLQWNEERKKEANGFNVLL